MKNKKKKKKKRQIYIFPSTKEVKFSDKTNFFFYDDLSFFFLSHLPKKGDIDHY